MTPEINSFEVEFLSTRQAVSVLFQFGAAFALWCILSLLLPHDRYIRYQQLTDSDLFRTRWVYERIHYDKTPIDVAIIGSSRLETAISAPILESELSKRFGRPIHVANLAIPEEGRNLHYLIIRELIENHPETRIVLVSVVEQADLSHPAFRYLANVSDLLRAPLLINHYYFLDTAFLPYRQMSYFVQTLFPGWFGMSRSFRQDYMGTNFDTTQSFYLPSGKLVDRNVVPPPEKLAAGSRQIIANYGGQWHRPSHWHAMNNPLETEYTKRLVDEAKRNCAEVVFVRLPFYNSPPGMYDEGFYRSLGPLLDAEPLSKDPHTYGDQGHFNRYGIDLVSVWLKKAIDPYLTPLDNTVSCSKQ
ncbi:MAG: hypothetical protein ABSE46_05205 [Terracidiphilus sp.]